MVELLLKMADARPAIHQGGIHTSINIFTFITEMKGPLFQCAQPGSEICLPVTRTFQFALRRLPGVGLCVCLEQVGKLVLLLDRGSKIVHNVIDWFDHLPVEVDMNNWAAPQRPNAYAEQSLIAAILDGTFAPGSRLPGERTLAVELGVTRPTLREALQRLARDGWVTVQQGKATVVNDYWQDGGLNVLSALINHGEHLPANFVTQLLEVRLNLAPAYTKAAVLHAPAEVSAYLQGISALNNSAEKFASFDWHLHRRLTLSSGNQIYTLIMNGFSDYYEQLARLYFASSSARGRSLHFYQELAEAAANRDGEKAEYVSRLAMLESIETWQHVDPWKNSM